MNPDQTVTVSASDLLWVLAEFTLLNSIAMKNLGFPEAPSIHYGAAERVAEALPQGVDLPVEAQASAMLLEVAVATGAL
jgi:hypothetical protein